MTQPPRKPLPPATQLSVFDRSRRRCALCFQLAGDLTEKRGQIAHLDDNRANDDEDNLAFLCLDHHSLYDSRTSQHKNYTMAEVKVARDKLYEAIARGDHLAAPVRQAMSNTGMEADRQTLARLIEIMVKSGSIDFLRTNNFAGWSFERSQLDGIQQFLSLNGPEYEYIDPDLEALRAAFRKACSTFMACVATNTFVVGNAGRQGVPEDWETDQPERFDRVVNELHTGADTLCTAYDELVRSARKKLSA